MGEKTAIGWTHHTFNGWWGCARVSPGCENCYAESNDKRYGGAHWGVNASRRFFGDGHWAEPYKWNINAKKAGVRRRAFAFSMADVGEDRPGLVPHRDRFWKVVAETTQLDWLILTKRPENMVHLVPWGTGTPWPNVWLGVTGENETYAVKRADILRTIPAVVRFISYEPALGRVNWARVFEGGGIDWVIPGGESGFSGRTRECQLEWLRHALAECRRFGVACFIKQLGRFPRDAGRLVQLRDRRAGADVSEFPEDLRVQDFPTPRIIATAA